MARPRSRIEGLSIVTRAHLLVAAVQPLLELFATVDAVFMEDDALSPEKRQMGLGRIYEAWKQCRATLDPEYNPSGDRRDRPDSRRRTPSRRTVRRARSPVFRTRRSR